MGQVRTNRARPPCVAVRAVGALGSAPAVARVPSRSPALGRAEVGRVRARARLARPFKFGVGAVSPAHRACFAPAHTTPSLSGVAKARYETKPLRFEVVR